MPALALASSLLLARVHPFGDVGLFRPQRNQQLIPEHAGIPPAARDLLASKCTDCHSTVTRAPFYGRLAPVSWLMERDIARGRSHMNLSDWSTYTPEQQQTLIAKIVQLARTQAMPLPQYRAIHWNSRITPADLEVLTAWAHAPSPATAYAASPALLPGDATRGEAVFEKRCTGCHSLATDREGPRLQNVYGRTTAGVPGFGYSVALRSAHLTWNDRTLDQWLTDPDAFLPGNNMTFRVARAQERQDLIAFLRQSAGAPVTTP